MAVVLQASSTEQVHNVNRQTILPKNSHYAQMYLIFKMCRDKKYVSFGLDKSGYLLFVYTEQN